MNRPLAWASAGSLGAGGLAVLLFREHQRLHALAAATLGADVVAGLREAGASSGVAPWLAGSLSDGLWQLGLTLGVLALWTDVLGPRRRALVAAGTVWIGVGVELGQAAGQFEGTFDVVDLAATVAAGGLAWAVSLAFGEYPGNSTSGVEIKVH